MAEQLRTLTGVWQQQGYGSVLEFKESGYKKYEYSSVHCLLVEQGRLKSFQDSIHYIQVNDKSQLILKSKYTLTHFYFERQEALPEVCERASAHGNTDPELNFEAFWHTFNEQYAFFEIRDVDWDQQYSIFRSQVTQDSNDAQLFDVFSEMVAPLRDGHVNLVSPARSFSVFNSRLHEQLRLEFEAQSEISDFYGYVGRVFDEFKTIAASYLMAPVKSGLNGWIRWGGLNYRLGYLGIDSMAGYSDTDESAVNVAALNDLLDQVMLELNSYEAVVIDLRINTGGMDEVAVALANRFVHQARLGFSKQARFGQGFTPLQEVYLSPHQSYSFLGPVMILISGATSSAAESFLLTMLNRPNVTTIGERTTGIFSDVLGKQLPNGWGFSLSNEIFRAAAGESYEGIGFAPDIEIEVMNQADRWQGVDSVLEYLLND